MNIFFTGASGFIGSHFHELIPNNKIINLDKNEPKFSHSAHFIKGNIRNKEDVELTLSSADCDIIISLAAEHKDFGVSEAEYFKTNEFGTKVLCDTATKYGIKKIIFYSSVAVYGDNKTPSNENTVPNPTNPYGASKLAGEKVLYQWASEDTSRSVLIIRPAVVYGERNVANMYRLINQINSGRYFNISEGKNVKSIAYVKNLVEATLFLMERMKPGVHIYNYSDKPQFTSLEIAKVITETLGKNNPITLPYWLVCTMAIPFDVAIKFTGKDLPVSTRRVKKLCTETYHKADKIISAGFIPMYTNTDGLKRMIDWMKKGIQKDEAIFDV